MGSKPSASYCSGLKTSRLIRLHAWLHSFGNMSETLFGSNFLGLHVLEMNI